MNSFSYSISIAKRIRSTRSESWVVVDQPLKITGIKRVWNVDDGSTILTSPLIFKTVIQS